jgi:hypothetical protein
MREISEQSALAATTLLWPQDVDNKFACLQCGVYSRGYTESFSLINPLKPCAARLHSLTFRLAGRSRRSSHTAWVAAEDTVDTIYLSAIVH